MGHGKLKKFAENETFRLLLQPEAAEIASRTEDGALLLHDHPVKDHWGDMMFEKKQPLIIELGCGKGEYTIALAERHPEYNYIGVDIKGARLWKGAKYATEHGLPNVAFLRTRIEFLPALFAEGEVSEIWLTFSDPQMKSENSRLTSPVFLERYRRLLIPGGIVHLKTDSRFLYEYTRAVTEENALPCLAATTDLYSTEPSVLEKESKGRLKDIEALFSVQTFYETMFLGMGIPITYQAFTLENDGELRRPESFDEAYWRQAEGPRRSFSHNPSKKIGI